MILVVKSYDTANTSGGRMIHHVIRKVFHDNDVDGVQKFMDERREISGYEWHNLSFKFMKL